MALRRGPIAKSVSAASARGAVSIVIPSLDEADGIGAMLDAVARLGGDVEVIVVDGGSRDETAEIARSRGATVLTAERGRGAQMRAGADAASGAVLWFLHADAIPPSGALEAIDDALGDNRAVGGSFAIRFDGELLAARFLTWLYPRLSLLGLRYGDSGIFVRRADYDAVGGFAAYPIFEDLDLVRKLRRRGRFVRAKGTVVASSRRFEGRSFALTFGRWAVMQGLYWLGVSPHRLAAHYAPIRARRQ